MTFRWGNLGDAVFTESLTTGPAKIGFRNRATLQDSPEQHRKTRLAVARAKQGDREALSFLYVTYSHNIYGYVRSIVHDDYEAEDVTQQVFAKLMTSLDKYDERNVPFVAWLLRLTRNLAIDHLRSSRVTPTDTVVGSEAVWTGELDELSTVRDALATLPVQQREVVILRHVVGLSPSEIAARMGRTEGSVHALHHRGRRALRREFERANAGPMIRPARTLIAA